MNAIRCVRGPSEEALRRRTRTRVESTAHVGLADGGSLLEGQGVERANGVRFETFNPNNEAGPTSRLLLMVSGDERGVVFGTLDAAVCRALLEGANVGRLGVSIDALPVVLPVNYAIDSETIIFRTTPGTKLSEALLKTVVAFEVDEYEPIGDVGWSVLVQGVASQIEDDEQITRARQLPLRLISAGGHSDRFVRIEMARITGRRLRPRFDGSA